ncbi:ABC transporter ATP-binding protein [Devriesea agamarum]|uniref:ABC transporter ATP-binding protein n=1 Tax=Devriesea agamarum TaxID=472569 RepID=UPI00071D11E3|nr:ATP-binding cassette domain-containing protein [Devriesea agamarum]
MRDLRRDFIVRSPQKGRRHRTKHIVHAVRDVSLTVEHGESVGFVGANGAGKSTTIKMMTGILVPSSGQVRTLGRQPVPERKHLARDIGVVFGQRSNLFWDLPLSDSFRILGAMHRLTERERTTRLDSLIDHLDLGPFLQRPVRQLSLGQRMRGEVAAALLHSPRLVILDEPTIGLDMISKENLRQFLSTDRKERGTTLFLTTHDMSDIERVCERLVVVSSGTMAYDGALSSFRLSLGMPRELVLDLVDARAQLDLPPQAHSASVEADGRRHRIRFSATEITAPALLEVISAQAQIADLAMSEPDIEDLVRDIYLTKARS